MEEQYNGPYKERLNELNERLKELISHSSMWAKSGGMGGKMAMQAQQEIEDLKAERTRILNGTQEKYEQIQDKINELKELKRQCHIIQFIKKKQLDNEITQYQKQQNELSKRTK